MVCQNCKTNLPQSAKFCTMCGAKINVSFCPNGHVLEPGEVKCRYCPSATEEDTTRISVSTTIDRLSGDNLATRTLPMTTIETEVPLIPAASAPTFGATRIVQSKEDEPVGLLGWLVITDGNEKWRDFKITKRKTSIGRSPECDVVLDNEQVSARHASLRLAEDGLYLTDLDSSNGTLVNDRELDRHKLTDNDLVTIGDVNLKFKAF